MTPHAEVKKYMPPSDAAVWKSRSDNAWHSEVKPFPSCNRRCSLHGESVAIRMVVSSAWHWWVILNGKETEDIGVDGILSLAEVEAV